MLDLPKNRLSPNLHVSLMSLSGSVQVMFLRSDWLLAVCFAPADNDTLTLHGYKVRSLPSPCGKELTKEVKPCKNFPFQKSIVEGNLTLTNNFQLLKHSHKYYTKLLYIQKMNAISSCLETSTRFQSSLHMVFLGNTQHSVTNRWRFTKKIAVINHKHANSQIHLATEYLGYANG